MAAASTEGRASDLPPHRHTRHLAARLAFTAALLAVAPIATGAPAPHSRAARPSPSKLPVAKTRGAGTILYQSVNLNGAVNPEGQPAVYFFQFGTTSQYGEQTPPVSLPAGNRLVAVKTPLAGLAPLTAYHYRLVAVAATGTAHGGEQTFTTSKIPLTLTIGGLPDPVVFGAPVTVVGTFPGVGPKGHLVVLQQNPFPFTSGFQNVGGPVVTLPKGIFSFVLAPLRVTTMFQVVSVGPGPPATTGPFTERVKLAVTVNATRESSTPGRLREQFTGLITPSQPGASVDLQQLTASHWTRVAVTASQSGAGVNSRYSIAANIHRDGFYRVHVTPLDSARLANTSAPVLVSAGPAATF